MQQAHELAVHGAADLLTALRIQGTGHRLVRLEIRGEIGSLQHPGGQIDAAAIGRPDGSSSGTGSDCQASRAIAPVVIMSRDFLQCIYGP